MKRNTVAVFMAAFVLVCGSAHAAPVNRTIREIKEPTFSQPQFVLPGGTVNVAIKLAGAGHVSRATLSPVVEKIQAVSVPLDAAVKSGGDAQFAVKLPQKIPAGLYNLCVNFKTGAFESSDCQPHSVSVVKSFDAPFTFVQITDYHKGDPRAEKQFPGVDIDAVRIAALEAANKANPTFVVFTGDINAYPETYDVDYPATVEEIVSHLKVPAIIIPGNHDFYTWINDKGKVTIDGETFWPDFFGPVHRVLDFGRFRFIFLDTYDWGATLRNSNQKYSLRSGKAHTYSGTLSETEFAWLEKALAGAGGREPILFAHHSPREFETNPVAWCKTCMKSADVLKLLEKYKVPYYFFGHIHRTDAYKAGPTQYYATTSTGSDVEKGKLWAIRIAHVGRNGKIETKVQQLFDKPPMK